MTDISTLLVVPKVEYCNANCKFCITHNIYDIEGFESIEEQPINLKKLEAVVKFAMRIGIIDANLTGGTEPTLADPEMVGNVTQLLSEYFGRVNMYTNGARLLNEVDGSKTLVKHLADSGLTNVTISRAHNDDIKNSSLMRLPQYDLEGTMEAILRNELDPKLSCLLSKEGVSSDEDIINYIEAVKALGGRKVIFRELLSVNDDSEYGKWANTNYTSVTNVSKLMERLGVPQFRGLWQQIIWDYKGTAVTIWPDGSRKDTINKGDLIYMPDNHLYSSWIHRSSRIM